MSARKSPQCRKCLHPMRGHKADFCSVSPSPAPRMKEEEDPDGHSSALYISPPPSPPPSESPSVDPSPSRGANKRRSTPIPPPVPAHREYTPAVMSEPSFIIPETGYFHRRNPNFLHLLTPQALEVPHAPGSLAPTEIVGSEDGHTVTASVRSASPTETEWHQAPQAVPSRPKEVLRGLGALFSVHETSVRGSHSERSGNFGLHAAPVTPPRPFGSARGRAGPNMHVAYVARTETMNSRFMRFIYDMFAYAPLFVVCLLASVLGGYICKTYL